MNYESKRLRKGGGGRGKHAFKLKKKFMEVGLGSEVYKATFVVCKFAVG